MLGITNFTYMQKFVLHLKGDFGVCSQRLDVN